MSEWKTPGVILNAIGFAVLAGILMKGDLDQRRWREREDARRALEVVELRKMAARDAALFEQYAKADEAYVAGEDNREADFKKRLEGIVPAVVAQEKWEAFRAKRAMDEVLELQRKQLRLLERDEARERAALDCRQ